MFVIKLIAILLLVLIAYNIFKAMKSMLKNDANEPPMSAFIGRRLMFSALLIIMLLLALVFGWIQPNPRPY